ncbi:Cellulase/cellobiase CelA1 (CelA1) [Fructobacillus evanidus]|uniref:Cellulase/cellobiase CelA1 (CelA1) n=1 Tax=Fructobacillus evanidus TaxID=3064281 RepID=A0ABM9N1Y6_9LACO|nr:Cellulase/cellobiase CelA1 (CelA1) [Fructobacillus sp. LMG 32999]CAK1248431.1 Cellulase/cellobiase CelA1 (CelA1) [Fructobacillus sp. LMG 32999]CAK1249244.1 Cellulase/cellobiase CelA1 (CelA1) [Fructobacillus sp. LMG 32999]CAK1254357.1 Cellulase/cellobiase CelA1 (CelA1) [Fructobacillus sp. LMG 32999]CAK1255164.1 Cellulase/cellobiase CelA1 (CelA1) [Fructobacillus sp. LMG 32999]
MTDIDYGYLKDDDGQRFYPITNYEVLTNKPDLSDFAKKSEIKTNSADLANKFSNLKTDKAIYNPNDVVIFNLTLNQSVAKIRITKFRNEQNLGSEDVLGYGNNFQYQWQVNGDDNAQYLVKFSNLDNNDNVVFSDYIAVNVNSNPGVFPIMGFLSKYDNYDPNAQKKIIEYLSRLHINYVQYYDWFEYHDIPLYTGDHNQPSAYWTDFANRPTRLDVIQKYIELCKERNMRSMAYGLMYGASTNQNINGLNDWSFLYDNKTTSHNPDGVTVNRLPHPMFKNDLYILNFLNDDTKKLIFDRWQDVFNALPFDGWHIDTLGDFGSKYPFNADVVDSNWLANVGYKYFVKGARDYFGNDKQLGVNAVATYGFNPIAGESVNYLYSEQWDFEAKTYDEIYQKIRQMRNVRSDIGLIIPAYIHKNKNWWNTNYQFNTDGVKLLNDVIIAGGATHLEMGEHMLSREYFPNSDVSMTQELIDYLPKQYDFMVAYHHELSINNPTDYFTLNRPNINSKNYVDNTKYTVIENSDSWVTSASIINTKGLNGNDWQDANADRKLPEPVYNEQAKFNSKFSHVYCATIENPEPIELSQDQWGNFVIPEIKNYTLIWGIR